MAVEEILGSSAVSAREIFLWSLGLCVCFVGTNLLKIQQRHVTDLALDIPLHGKPTNIQLILPPFEVVSRPKDMGRLTPESSLVHYQWQTSL